MDRRTTCQTEEGCIIIYIGNCKACNPEEGGDETGKTGEDRSRIRGKPLTEGNNMEQMQREKDDAEGEQD